MARWRDKTLSIRLTDEEREAIKTQMKRAGSKNTADFILTCVCNHTTNVIDTKPLMAVKTELSRIGNNVNQIAKVANTSKSIYYNEVLALKMQLDDVRKVVDKAFDFCIKER